MDLNQRIEVVCLMAKHESVTVVRRILQKLKWEHVPHENAIRNLFKKFKKVGSVADTPRSGRPALDDEKKEEIEQFFQENPKSSIRKASAALQTSIGAVHKVVKHDLKLFPYKLQITQKLYEEDLALRVHMCEVLLSKINDDENFWQNLIFSDESRFSLDGTVNRHNCRIWGIEKPTETLQKSHSSPKVNVWMGISIRQIYGPFFFDENVRGDNYLDMLQRCFIPSLTRQDKRCAVFQQDGAPAHYALIVRQFLDANFPDRWLGRCGPLLWAPRSPDLTPLDFFVWGHLKTQVFSRKPQTLQQLKDLICEEAQNISLEMCQNALSSFRSRLEKCIELKGANVDAK